jgi:hypothetical protein
MNYCKSLTRGQKFTWSSYTYCSAVTSNTAFLKSGSFGNRGVRRELSRVPKNADEMWTFFYVVVIFTDFFFFFSFGVLQLMLPEAPQPYGLLYYPRIGLSNFLHEFRAATTPKSRKLEL